MRLFGLEITRAKAAAAARPVDDGRGWWPIISEPFTGAWQRNEELRVETGLSNPTVFACISLISSDFAKLRVCLVQEDADGIWSETKSPAFSPVLRKPNHYQNRIQFFECWSQSKQSRGNTYVLLERDNRNVVTAMHVLDPDRVQPLVAPDGSVYYRLNADHLAGVGESVVVPAKEIIHDRWNTLFHPLVGLSPLYAAAMAALQGLEIPRASTKFFRNGSKPGGVLTAPGKIGQETADRLKADWEVNYTGENIGKVAVLGDGLKYENLSVSAVDAQLIDQLKWSAETICSCFRMPAFKVGVGPVPANNNGELLDQQYYSQCLQIQYESAELCLDEGLALPDHLGTEFDIGGLLRMDTATQIKTLAEGVKGGLMKPDEGRKKLNLGKVKGGNAVYLQQQNFSLEALAKRDAKEDPFSTGGGASSPAAPPANDDDTPNEAEAAKALLAITKGLAHVGR